MKKQVLICGLAALMVGMVSCKSQQNGVKTNEVITVDASDDSQNILDENLVEKYWRLTELLGEPVTTPEGAKEAYMILKKEDSRVTGTSGCNTFSGSFTLKPFNRITFSRSISTMMMCPNMDTETKLYKALETADSYIIKDDVLILNRGRMAPLARFEAVYMN